MPSFISTIAPEQLRILRLVIFDFDGVFTDNRVWVTEHGVEQICCNRSDGLGLARLRELDIATVILSTETNPVVSVRAEKLKTPCYQSIEDKRASVVRMMAEYGVEPEQTAFVGNDINDIPAFGVVGLAIATADAFLEARKHAHFITEVPGGQGAVREICDQIYWAHTSSTLHSN
jgi:3-deoxy-D-manno-octulosonate 8-phosphate phosphatase (KDO 8-P phosphatase)